MRLKSKSKLSQPPLVLCHSHIQSVFYLCTKYFPRISTICCTINWHWLVSFCIHRTDFAPCIAKSANEFTWIFHLRWYIKRIYINYRCKWCYVHFNQTLALALALVSISQSIDLGVNFSPQFDVILLYISHTIHFYLYVYNCLCTFECLCVCVFFRVVINMKWDEMPWLLLPGEKESGRRTERDRRVLNSIDKIFNFKNPCRTPNNRLKINNKLEWFDFKFYHTVFINIYLIGVEAKIVWRAIECVYVCVWVSDNVNREIPLFISGRTIPTP